MMSKAGADGAREAGDAARQASVLAATVLCLLLAVRVTVALGALGPATATPPLQVPVTVALFVVPILYAFSAPRRVLVRHQGLVLAVQSVLTWVPFALFGGAWEVGMGGLLAGLVLLTLPGRVSWLLAGALLAADVLVRATVTGLPLSHGWPGALWAVITFADDAAIFFGLIRLAQLLGELLQARGQEARLAVAAERLQAADTLRSAVGECLADVAVAAAAARRALPGDPGGARAHVTAAGAAAREAIAQARAVADGRRHLPRPEPAIAPPGGAATGARVAWAALVVVLCGFAAAGLNDAVIGGTGSRLIALLGIGSVLGAALQLHHSRAVRQGGRPRWWALTLGLQAALVYAFLLSPLGAHTTLTPFLAGSVLLLVPGWWRWAGYAAVILSSSALVATFPGNRSWAFILYAVFSFAEIGLLVYGLSRLAGTASELEVLRGELAGMAAVRERLRVARDVHDLLGLGLSAIALKTDLIGKLIGRDTARAAAEIGELARICAVARADIPLLTGDGQRLSLAGELAAAQQMLASAGVQVHASIPAGTLPAFAGEVLAPVLREAVTNILRHAAASTCVIQATVTGNWLRLRIGNDGVTEQTAAPERASESGTSDGSGLANLTARVQAASGRLVARQAEGGFELTAEIPLHSAPGAADAVTGPIAVLRARPASRRRAGGR